VEYRLSAEVLMQVKELIMRALVAMALLFLVLAAATAMAQDSVTTDEDETQVDTEAAADADAGAGAATDEETVAEEAESGTPGPRFKSVGMLPIENETRVMRGGETMTRILLGRLERKFGDAKFVGIDLEEDETSPGGPILLTEAKRLGEKYDVDALIDGTLLGFEITGGIWPSRAMPYPEARAVFRLRVIRTSDGTVYKYYTHKPKKPKAYSPGIRNERDLFGRVVREAIDELAKQMKRDGLFWEGEQEE